MKARQTSIIPYLQFPYFCELLSRNFKNVTDTIAKSKLKILYILKSIFSFVVVYRQMIYPLSIQVYRKLLNFCIQYRQQIITLIMLSFLTCVHLTIYKLSADAVNERDFDMQIIFYTHTHRYLTIKKNNFKRSRVVPLPKKIADSYCIFNNKSIIVVRLR